MCRQPAPPTPGGAPSVRRGLVADGDGLLSPGLTRRLITEFAQRYRPAPTLSRLAGDLTARELQVLQSLAQGESNAEIARSLNLSENTVKTHVTHIRDKLGLRDRVQAVIFAYESGIIAPGNRHRRS